MIIDLSKQKKSESYLLNENLNKHKKKNILKKISYRIKNYLKKKNFFLNQILNKYYSSILFLISYYLYYLSLEKCFEGPAICCQKILWIKTKIIEETLSCLILSLLMQLIFYKIITKFHLIHMTFIFVYFYKYSHGLDFNDHGFFNIAGFIALFLLILLILFPLNVIIYLNKNIFYYLVLIFFIFLLYKIFEHTSLNCYDWAKGLNNTYIQNNHSIYGCQIPFPKICPYKFGKYFLDLTKIKGINCKYIQTNYKETIIKKSNSPYLNKTFKRIGYPLTNKDSVCFLDYRSDIIKKFFIQNLVNMENKEILNTVFKNKEPEIQIDFKNNDIGEMIINVNFNSSLSEERKTKELNSHPYSNNINFI